MLQLLLQLGRIELLVLLLINVGLLLTVVEDDEVSIVGGLDL